MVGPLPFPFLLLQPLIKKALSLARTTQAARLSRYQLYPSVAVPSPYLPEVSLTVPEFDYPSPLWERSPLAFGT
ncbi:hypothetical protein EDB89DRAFT_1975744 [Lactarius sanguifluus]|nr:hypothetical protein EDB89DRAFT_1975744 [Lactarius sanguifluus]